MTADLAAERDTLRNLRNELASKVQAVLELVFDESWHVGGAWGDYGEPVLLARNVAEALGKDYDESREDRSADFAANVAEAQEAAYLAEAERDRYRVALETIALAVHADTPASIARAALDRAGTTP